LIARVLRYVGIEATHDDHLRLIYNAAGCPRLATKPDLTWRFPIL
jgi:hypothetical protein